MIIRVDPRRADPVSLEQADDPRRFHVETVGSMTAEDLACALEPHGIAVRDGHAFVPPSAVVALAGPDHTAAWQDDLSGMVAYARAKGWADGTGAIRAHVEVAPAG